MQLLYEARIIKHLQGGKGIPKIYWHGTDGEYNVMVMQLFEDNLEELFSRCKRKFTLKTVLMAAEQFVRFDTYS